MIFFLSSLLQEDRLCSKDIGCQRFLELSQLWRERGGNFFPLSLGISYVGKKRHKKGRRDLFLSFAQWLFYNVRFFPLGSAVFFPTTRKMSKVALSSFRTRIARPWNAETATQPGWKFKFKKQTLVIFLKKVAYQRIRNSLPHNPKKKPTWT